MNAPTADHARPAEAPEAITSHQWYRIAAPLGIGLILLGVLFNREVVAAVQTWEASTAYNHCFLVIPIVLYLLWDRRFDLTGIAPRPMPGALWLGVPLALAWLAAERLGIMEGRQIAAISFAELLFLAVLGKRLSRAVAGPLLYLYFLVPFGEFLTPRLQDFTTWFIRHGLEILRVPAFIDGYIIDIPQGTFFVAEACAGLRFLIASVAFGCLYALMMYRSPLRRGLFILVSIIVPIIANGFRGLGIVYLGYLLNSAQAAAADHIIYGWVFFSTVIVLLIALGLPFRQDEFPTISPARPKDPAAVPRSVRGIFAIALGVVVVAAITPTMAAVLTIATASRIDGPASIEVGPGCVVHIADPAGSVSGHVKTQRVDCGGVAMDMTWETFSPRITAAPLMAERRRLVIRTQNEGLQERWLQTADGVPSTWRIMTTDNPPFAIAVSTWIDGRPVRPGMAMRAKMAINSLFGSAFAPVVVTVTPVVGWEGMSGSRLKSAEADLQAFLLSHPNLGEVVGAMSVL